jgi:chemotaxis protein histidine kinase CheA
VRDVSNPDSSEPHDTDWERELQRLREIYRRKLRAEIVTLDANLREARDAAPAQPKLDAARRHAHRLKGTSGSYGLEASCAALEGIEEQLERVQKGTTRDLRAAWAAIEEALERVRAGLE